MDRYVAFCALAMLVASTGCNKSSESTDTASPETQGASATATPQPTGAVESPPDKVVTEFLEAIRIGNEEIASALLTPKAREKTSEANLAIAPPGSPTATYMVGEVEFITPNKDGAHVFSTWIEVNEDGSKHTDEIIWALRKEPAGWRIAGSLMKLIPGRPPLVLDYEDPEDMQRTIEKYYEEEAKAQNQQAGSKDAQPQAKVPESTPPVTR